MVKKIPRNELLSIIEKFTEGASLEEIMHSFASSIPRRTLQRWLSILVKENKLTPIGKARARRYKIKEREKKEVPQSPIPLSGEGEKTQSIVIQPIQKREPIGYHREFLEQYIPNKSYYLPESLRKKLAQIGYRDGKYPSGTYVKQIFHRLLIDLSWNSSRLEGNTYSLLETERLLETGQVAEGKNLVETQMILNHKDAIEFLIHSAEKIEVSRYVILNLHTLLSDNLFTDAQSCGKLRSFPVGIEKSVYMPSSVPQVIEECFNTLISKAKKIKDPFEQAFFLLVQLPYLQPFEDVNKRTSRLAANIPLIKGNFSPLSFIDVPQDIYINGLLGVYELNKVDLLRDLFEWAYARSCTLYSLTQRALGDPDPLRIKYRDALRYLIRDIVRNQLNKKEAKQRIDKWTKVMIEESDRKHFKEIVNSELQNIHEGNIAKFRIELSEFKNWQRVWQ